MDTKDTTPAVSGLDKSKPDSGKLDDAFKQKARAHVAATSAEQRPALARTIQNNNDLTAAQKSFILDLLK